MKKILSLLSLLMLCIVGVNADSVDDLVAVGPGYTFIADNITANGTTKLNANTLYDEGRIFANTGNSVASNKGKITIGGEEHLNSLRIKNTQDQLVFKVSEPCVVKFYTQSHSERGLQVGSKSGGTEFGSEPTHTTEWECAITAAGLVYLSSYGSDFYFAGFEVKAATKSITFTKPDNWKSVYVWAWNSDGNLFDQWPGLELTANDDGKYVWETTENPEKIIFNNGDSGEGNQTETFDFKDGGEYTFEGRVITLNNYTVNFKSDGGWQEVYAYTWTGNDGEWPGKPMKKAGDGEWTITIQAEEAPANILFHNNAGAQTPDWTFVADKTYEYNLNTYTATFTTDAGWEDVYAWIWNNDNGKITNLSTEDWPGDKLEENGGVYTYTYKAFTAAQMILFNGGDDTKKTPDMGFTNGRAYKWNTTLQPLYTLEASETAIPAGTTVEVKDGDGDLVATLIYGASDDANNFAAPTLRANEEYAAFQNYTGGNGKDVTISDGIPTKGTFYTIKPVYDGTITVGVWLNSNKNFYITEDGKALEEYNGIRKDYASGTAFEFAVKAGSIYRIYCTGSKLGFYGFDYKFTKPELPAFTATFTTDLPTWQKVYAYAWSGDGDAATKFLGEWPGTELTATEGVYTVSIQGETAPEKIIFNDGTVDNAQVGVNKTPDLAFVDGNAYSYTKADIAAAALAEAKQKLQEAIDKVNAYNIAALKDAVETAQAAHDATDATRESLAAAGKALENAVKEYAQPLLQKALALVAYLPSGNTDLADAVATASALGEGASAEELVNALNTLVAAALPEAQNLLDLAKEFATKYGYNNLIPVINNAKSVVATGNIDNISTMFTALSSQVGTVAEDAIGKVEKYVEVINNAELSAALAEAKALIDAKNYMAAISALKNVADKFVPAATAFAASIEFDADKAKGAELAAALQEVQTAIQTEGTTIVTIGEKVQALILAYNAYVEANTTYTIAGTKDLTGTENDWDIVEANNMTLDTESGLYTWTAENITVTNENQPMFKVVITDSDGNQTWIPASDAEGDHNWIITPNVVGDVGVFNITITFNANTQVIAVTGEKVVNPDEPQLLVLPEGVELATYRLTALAHEWGPNNNIEKDVQVGFQDDKIYIQGLNPNNTDAWIYGTVNEDEVRITCNQLINIIKSGDEVSYEWLRISYEDAMAHPEDPNYPSDPDMILSYDRIHGVLTTNYMAFISGRAADENEYVAPLTSYWYDGMTLTAPVPEYTLGDVNDDGEVTTTDAVMAVDFALDKHTPTQAQFLAADVVKSDEITITDAVAIVNMALKLPDPNEEVNGARMNGGYGYLTMNGQSLNLTNAVSFVGFQMDVTLAEGTQFNGVQLAERAAGLNVAYNQVGENTWRIIAFSLQNNRISGNEGTLLTLDITGNSTVNVTNIEFADAAARAYVLDFNGEATGINGVYSNVAGSDIYNLNGVRSNTMQKGVNIIRNANGEVKKVFVK